MKQIFLFLIAATFSYGANAQIDAKSKEILSKAATKTKTYTTISATFDITITNEQTNSEETHDGSIEVKGEKYHLKLINNESFFDGKTVWTLMTDAKEVNVSEPDPNDDNVLNPAKIFALYEKGFKAQYIGEVKDGTKNLQEIHLFPESHNKPYSRIKIFVDSESSNISKIEQIGKDGNNILVKIKKFTVNQPLVDTIFVYDVAKHPGIDVIDLR